MEKVIRSKEEIIMEMQWYKSGVITTKEKLDELILKLDNLGDELAEVERLEKKAWKPQMEERYWYVSPTGEVATFAWTGDMTDKWNYTNNNCFNTKAEAERRKFELELEGKARLFQLENNEDEAKYYLYYNTESKEVEVALIHIHLCADRLGYFSSYGLAEQFINENEEDLIKYFEGIKGK